jgi:hypothetical protein
MKSFLKVTGFMIMFVIIIIAIWVYHNLRDQHRGFSADMKIIQKERSALRVGFAAVSITPEVIDHWVDANNNASYDPKEGDTFTDGNGNGKFDPLWLAGFGDRRAANGVHDELWARTMIIDDGNTRLAFVAIDAIGLMNNEICDIREQIPDSARITYSIIASTHSHEVPDLLGLWGVSHFKTGVNRKYMEYVKGQIVKSITEAVASIRPAILEISEDLTGSEGLVSDSRIPVVKDPGVRVIRAEDKESGQTLGTLVSWADHPETLWSRNFQITSDFPHFLREGVERGIYSGDSLVRKGLGGITVYLNGAIGGLMTTNPDLAIKDPITGEEFSIPSFEKASALGRQVALLALKATEKPSEKIDSASISIIVRSIMLPIENKNFRLGAALGIFSRGTSGWMRVKSELAVINIGPVSIVTLPGEVYPEIINGGIEAPPGRDFEVDPLEVPPMREMMSGRYKFIIGLANDEIGYIIPKSQWDAKEPYAYGLNKDQYGEENSLGPETAPILHKNLREMLAELNGK